MIPFQGRHLFGSYLGCDPVALRDFAGLRKAMGEAVSASGATLLNTVEHIFPPDGITILMLLSESHASIHTYPEHGACFVDLFTCGMRCSGERFDELLRAYLRPAEAEVSFADRGGDGAALHTSANALTDLSSSRGSCSFPTPGLR